MSDRAESRYQQYMRAQIQALRAQIPFDEKNIEYKKKVIKDLEFKLNKPAEDRIAERLHSRLCDLDTGDGTQCDWYKEQNGLCNSSYLNKAKELLKIANEDVIYEILDVLEFDDLPRIP